MHLVDYDLFDTLQFSLYEVNVVDSTERIFIIIEGQITIQHRRCIRLEFVLLEHVVHEALVLDLDCTDDSIKLLVCSLNSRGNRVHAVHRPAYNTFFSFSSRNAFA